MHFEFVPASGFPISKLEFLASSNAEIAFTLENPKSWLTREEKSVYAFVSRMRRRKKIFSKASIPMKYSFAVSWRHQLRFVRERPETLVLELSVAPTFPVLLGEILLLGRDCLISSEEKTDNKVGKCSPSWFSSMDENTSCKCSSCFVRWSMNSFLLRSPVFDTSEALRKSWKKKLKFRSGSRRLNYAVVGKWKFYEKNRDL